MIQYEYKILRFPASFPGIINTKIDDHILNNLNRVGLQGWRVKQMWLYEKALGRLDGTFASGYYHEFYIERSLKLKADLTRLETETTTQDVYSVRDLKLRWGVSEQTVFRYQSKFALPLQTQEYPLSPTGFRWIILSEELLVWERDCGQALKIHKGLRLNLRRKRAQLQRLVESGEDDEDADSSEE